MYGDVAEGGAMNEQGPSVANPRAIAPTYDFIAVFAEEGCL